MPQPFYPPRLTVNLSLPDFESRLVTKAYSCFEWILDMTGTSRFRCACPLFKKSLDQICMLCLLG